MMVLEIFNIFILVEAIWLILPAYAANGLVPLLKGKRRLDFNKKFFDGKDILGQGKTLEGFIFGGIIGAVIATIEMVEFAYLPWHLSQVPLAIVPMSPLLGFLLGFGAMTGDSAGSFIKRRFDLKRGQKAPLLDQLDFIIGALLFSSLLISLKFEWIILVVVITPLIHWLASAIGYLLKVKREPW